MPFGTSAARAAGRQMCAQLDRAIGLDPCPVVNISVAVLRTGFRADPVELCAALTGLAASLLASGKFTHLEAVSLLDGWTRAAVADDGAAS